MATFFDEVKGNCDCISRMLDDGGEFSIGCIFTSVFVCSYRSWKLAKLNRLRIASGSS